MKRRHHLEFGVGWMLLALLNLLSWFFRMPDPFKLFLAAGFAALVASQLWAYRSRKTPTLVETRE